MLLAVLLSRRIESINNVGLMLGLLKPWFFGIRSRRLLTFVGVLEIPMSPLVHLLSFQQTEILDSPFYYYFKSNSRLSFLPPISY